MACVHYLKRPVSGLAEAEELRSRLSRPMARDAELAICEAVEELALQLSHCDRHWRNGRLRDLRRSAGALAEIAARIGMTTLAGVAGDVITCIGAGDHVALAATQARLAWVGDLLLVTIWDFQDLSAW